VNDPEAKRNHLLAALPGDAWQRWNVNLQPADLSLGMGLHEPGIPQQFAYFPTTAIVSLMYVLADGASVETAMVGNEGVVGVPLILGGDRTPSRAVVRTAGRGFRVASRFLREEFGRHAPVMQLMLRYTQALITQLAQTAMCNRHHTLDQQLCRWILTNLDRRQGNELMVTHELIASMLGVRREGVTEAALKLQRAGLVHYSRGHITVLDRCGLEQRACECYAVVKRECARLMPNFQGVESDETHPA
jgi:CRP-like cAMP-binding protein